MSLIDSHTPVATTGKIPYTLSWSTRHGKDILGDYDIRRVMLDALDSAADTNDARVLSVATTASSVRCHVLAPASLSPSTLLSRLKNAAARAIALAHPKLAASHGAVLRRTGQVEPFVPGSFRVPTHARSRGTGFEIASAVQAASDRLSSTESDFREIPQPMPETADAA